ERDDGAKSRGRHFLLTLTHAVTLMFVSALYVTLLGDQALMRGRNTSNGLVDIITGAPRGINSTKLLLFAVMLAFLLVITSLILHAAMRDGGWLRERIDRLRTPTVRRGALGSSHFCTMREYR